MLSLPCQEVPEAEEQPEELDVLTEEQKKQLGELQLFKNKEDNLSIEVSLRLPHACMTPVKNSFENFM